MAVNPDANGCRELALGAGAIAASVVSGMVGLAVKVHREQKQREANQPQSNRPDSSRRRPNP